MAKAATVTDLATAVDNIDNVDDSKKLGGRYNILPERVLIIGLDTNDGPDHPGWDARKDLPVEEADIQDVMENFRDGGPGIIQDVVVTRDKKYPGRWIVTNGRQRVKWLREVNKRLIALNQEPRMLPIVNKGVDGDPRLLLGMQISSNEHVISNDLIIRMTNLSRWITTQGDDLEKPSGDTIDSAAIRFKVSTATIKNWLKLRKLVVAVQEMVRDGKLTMVQALPLAKLPADKQLAAAKEIAASEGSSKSKQEKAKQLGEGSDEGDAEGGEGDGEGSSSGKVRVNSPVKRASLIAGVLGLALEDKATNSGAGTELSEEFCRALRWVLGDLSTRSISGLTELSHRYTEGERPVRPVKPKQAKAKADESDEGEAEDE